MKPGVGALTAATLALWVARAGADEGALGVVVEQIASGVGSVAPATLVVSSPLASDQPAPRAAELATRLATLAASRLRASAHPQPLAVSSARQAARSAPALLFLHVEVARGELRVTADVLPLAPNPWDRARRLTPPLVGHAFAHAPLDAEVRSYLTPVLLEQASVRKARHDMGDVLAAACGDLDADGGADIVLVTRDRVAVGHVRREAFAADRLFALSGAVPRAGVPLREPIATAVIDAAETSTPLRVGSTDFGGIALDVTLVPRGVLRGLPLAMPERDVCARPRAEASALDGAFFHCKGADRAAMLAPSNRVDAASGSRIIGPAGGSTSLIAVREPGGRLSLRRGGELRSVDGVGAQLATGDLDQDGVGELVTTVDGPEDAIQVVSVEDAGLRPRLRIPAPAGVRALAVCSPEERGVPALLAVVGSEVWIVR